MQTDQTFLLRALGYCNFTADLTLYAVSTATQKKVHFSNQNPSRRRGGDDVVCGLGWARFSPVLSPPGPTLGLNPQSCKFSVFQSTVLQFLYILTCELSSQFEGFFDNFCLNTKHEPSGTPAHGRLLEISLERFNYP